MGADSEMAKREIEHMVLDRLLDAFPDITGRTLTEDWVGEASKIEGSPDHIIGLDGAPFGVELTEIRGAGDAWDYVAEAYRLAARKSESYTRRDLFKFPIALAMYSTSPALCEIRHALDDAIYRTDFEALGFVEIWAVDFSDAYYSAGDPRRPPDLYCFKPRDWSGFHRIGGDRKPFG